MKAAFALVGALLLVGASVAQRTAPQQGTAKKLAGSVVLSENFTVHDPQTWVKSTVPNSAAPFKYTGWSKDNICIGNGLTLTLTSCRQQDCLALRRPYRSGEYQTVNTYHYGQYWVRMKAAKGQGLVTGFFTYQGTPWDEIDIEILGHKTDHAQVNYFSQGKPLCDPNTSPTWTANCGQPMVKLGFDAADGYHDYMIDWQQTYIKWWVYVEPSPQVASYAAKPWKLLYQATGTKPNEPPLPVSAGKIILNLWASCEPLWTGKCTFKPPVSAYYDTVRHTTYGTGYDPNAVVMPDFKQ